MVEAALKKLPKGVEWLSSLNLAREPWFNISTGTGWFHHDRSWNDQMNVPLSGIATYIGKLKQGVSIDRPTEKVRAERDRITAEYRGLIENDADRKQFDELLGCAKTVFPYVENHLFYVEHWFHSVFWNKMREVAAIMKEHGVIDDVEDVWLLRRDEVKSALWDIVTAWATGVTPRGTMTWPKEIVWRKGVMQKFKEWSPPPAIGTAPEVIQEPFTIVLWGVTNKSLADWAAVQEVKDPESITELKGFAGSPGIRRRQGARLPNGGRGGRVARRRNPRRADHLAFVGAGVRQDRRLHHRCRRRDEPCRDRLPRVRHAGRGGHRARDEDHQDRHDDSRRRLDRRGHDRALRSARRWAASPKHWPGPRRAALRRAAPGLLVRGLSPRRGGAGRRQVRLAGRVDLRRCARAAGLRAHHRRLPALHGRW